MRPLEFHLAGRRVLVPRVAPPIAWLAVQAVPEMTRVRTLGTHVQVLKLIAWPPPAPENGVPDPHRLKQSP